MLEALGLAAADVSKKSIPHMDSMSRLGVYGRIASLLKRLLEATLPDIPGPSTIGESRSEIPLLDTRV